MPETGVVDALHSLLSTVTLPKMARIRQSFNDAHVEDVPEAVRRALNACPAYAAVKPGMRLAVTVGSRGIASLPEIVATLVGALRARGAEPFIVPAMGSHGGGTAQGQTELLARLGVTESSAGCPIRSGMEVVRVGALADGFPVYMDRFAHEADGVVVFNRIKPHNAFRSRHESGLLKMLAIGLGKHKGAESSHSLGFGQLGRIIEEVSGVLLRTGKVVLGVGTIENAYDEVAEIAACGPPEMFDTDREGLKRAMANMPRLCVDRLDVLIVDMIGKEFSGGGMDGNIIGRYSTPYISGGPAVERVVALDLSDKSHGNGNGVGLADAVPKALVEKIDLPTTYINNITSKATPSGRIPITLDTEEAAIRCGLKTCSAPEGKKARVMRIPNTLHLDEAFVSEALLPEVGMLEHVTVLGEPGVMRFDASGKLAMPY
jgi:hypothetical protein